ncbi:M48 family metallopeptidase [uncultured Paraglaciecola sp.]|uniref:M48 family metallopeptidase n=1 Tax=uncultured Paraglaciecola sp. TaxID=1765024 RepID=UPI0026288523|nr:SprT family zinc-dependent metalloprotease [uncultured Paraglaciecola sp.]
MSNPRGFAIVRHVIDRTNGPLHYSLRRHPKARGLRIRITPFDGVIVTMPKYPGRYLDVDRFVLENEEWIAAKLEECGLDNTGTVAQTLDLNSPMFVEGLPYRFAIGSVGTLEAGDSSVRIDDDGQLILRNADVRVERFEENLRGLLFERAGSRITEAAGELALQLAVEPQKIKVRSLKSRWGSCTSDGRLVFNWRLVLFPPRILRYVVLHELCHLRHFDHSQAFWDLVARHDREYEEKVEWLRTNGIRADWLAVGLP